MSYSIKNAHILIDALAKSGVALFCIAPGSRSTALTIAAAKRSTCVHFDERALGFYAQGHAKATKKPTAIIVTSGTAVGNLLPSIMEAKENSAPVLILSADRPLELLHAGQNQTTTQTSIFSPFVCWQTALFLSDPGLKKATIDSIAAYSIWRLQKGPIHLNLLLREPFSGAFSQEKNDLKAIPSYTTPQIKKVAIDIPPCKGDTWILVGENQQDLSCVGALSTKYSWPIFCDPLSNIDHPLAHRSFELWIDQVEKRPKNILHFGGRFVGKHLFEWLQKKPPPFYGYVHEDENCFDPFRLITHRFCMPPALFCPHVKGDKGPDLSSFTSFKKPLSLQERYLQTLGALLPDQWGIFWGNSTVIRDAANAFYSPFQPPSFGNRGVSGIDGNIASICGIAKGKNRPFVGVIGDLAFLHDSNSCSLIKNSALPILLIVLNNQGGEIFRRLPIEESSENIDRFFVTKHAFSFEGIAKSFQLPYARVQSIDMFSKSMKKIFNMKKSALVEVTLT